MLGSTHPCSWLSRHARESRTAATAPHAGQVTGETQSWARNPARSLPVPPRAELRTSLDAGAAAAPTPARGLCAGRTTGKRANNLEATCCRKPVPRARASALLPAPITRAWWRRTPQSVCPSLKRNLGTGPILGLTPVPSYHQQTRSPSHWCWGLAGRWEPAGTGRAICTGRRSPECPRQPPASPSGMGGRPTPAPRRFMLVRLILPRALHPALKPREASSKSSRAWGIGPAGEGGQFGGMEEQGGSPSGEGLAPDKRSQPPGCRVNAERGLMEARACAAPGSSHTPWRQHMSTASEEAGAARRKNVEDHSVSLP